jgi:hypothetical protein
MTGPDRTGDGSEGRDDGASGADGDYGGYGDAADIDDRGPGRDADADEPPEEAAVSTTERVVMVAAVALTVGLFSFAVWNALAGASAAEPTATVSGERGQRGDATYYGVTLRTEGGTGLVAATVSVTCPDPRRQVTFENVPANAHRNATVSCPEGGEPSAEVVSWIPV